MADFIKLEVDNNTFYINVEKIVAVNEEKCIVYTENDNFFVTPENIEHLVQKIETRLM